MLIKSLRLSVLITTCFSLNAIAGTMGAVVEQKASNIGRASVQLGYYNAHQGRAQNVYIQNLIGDYFSLKKNNGQNALIGAGYYFNGPQYKAFNLQYGLNAFYLFQTKVSGTVTQEQTFTNLSYQYKLSHLPVFLGVKALFGDEKAAYQPTFDFGMGPNFMMTSGFSESALNPQTLPDRIFKGTTNTVFSANLGVGLRANQLLSFASLDCGYRLMYLGKGHLKTINNQVLSTFSTGDVYVNSLVCGLTF